MTDHALATSRPAVGDSRQLIELLTQQSVLYQAISRLGEQQSKLVAEGNAEALLGLLAQRQHLLDRLAQINQQLDPYRQDWRQVYDALAADDQHRVSQLVDQVQQLLARIIAQDEADRQTLQQTRDVTSGQLRHVGRGGQAAAAYGAAGPRPQPRYTNHQG